MIALEMHFVVCVEVVVQPVFCGLCAERKLAEYAQLVRAAQVLGLEVAKVGQVFFEQNVVRVQGPDSVLLEDGNYIVYFVERVLLPEWLDGAAHSHQQLVAAARMFLDEVC